jgi:hypothetical protein
MHECMRWELVGRKEPSGKGNGKGPEVEQTVYSTLVA